MRYRLIGTILLIACAAGAGCGRVGVDARDEHGMTALMRAARAGDSAQVARLLDRGASVNAKVPTRDVRELIAFLSWMQQLPESDIGYTPLMYAATSGNVGVARLLLARGAEIESKARDGWSSLDVAIARGHAHMMRALLGAGARAEPAQLRLAIALSQHEAVRHLLGAGVDPNAVPPRPIRTGPPAVPPIILAARMQDTISVGLLLDAGARPDVADQNGWTALRWAAETQSRGRNRPAGDRMVVMLQARGARDEEGVKEKALLDALDRRDVAAIRAALDSGANANARDDRGVTALVHAAQFGLEAAVDALLRAGADVNATSRNDATPLIAAIEGGHVDVVRALLRAGARPTLRDHIRRTPLQVAAQFRRPAIVAILLEAGVPLDSTLLPYAALSGDTTSVRLLLARGANPNAANGHALSEATRGCYRGATASVIRQLLIAGANPALPATYPPIVRAAGLCPTEVAALLLERGANPNARTESGYTALMGAASAGNLETVRLLVSRGADVNARDPGGKSVLAHAERHPAVAAELRNSGAR